LPRLAPEVRDCIPGARSLSKHVLYATHWANWLLFSELLIQLSWVAAVLAGSLFDLREVCLLTIAVQIVGFVVHAYYMKRIVGTKPIDWLTIFALMAPSHLRRRPSLLF
jgi:hypothetical protein